MPSDVRLGLVVGVGLVFAIAVVTFRKDDTVGGRAESVQLPAPTGRVGVPAPSSRAAAPKPREHTVQPGETLVSLAVRYYGDSSRSTFLFRANQDRLLAPDRVPVGTVLFIPDAPLEH